MRAINLDAAGIGLASLCIVHCLVFPLIVAGLPMLSDILDLPDAFHLGMILLALPLSGFALVRGYGLHHHRAPAAIGSAGLALMTGAVTLATNEAWETGPTVLGSLLLSGAHLWNWRLHSR